MPIDRDLSGLPRGEADQPTGRKPDPAPRFGHILAEAWMEREHQRESTRLARYRHSDAGACARMLAYAALDVPISDLMDQAGIFITTQGSIIHEAWQQALVAKYGGAATIEVAVHDGDRGGHIDAEVYQGMTPTGEDSPWVTVIEGKSVGGFRFKKAVGCPPAGRVAEGPSYNHIIQGALGAKARNADEMVVIYWTREAISVEAAARNGFDELGRIIAEWTYDRATFTAIAEAEIARVERVLKIVDAGELPKRVIPDPELPQGHVIVRPLEGGWVQYDGQGIALRTGSTWHCNYCKYQTLCASHPAERVSLVDIPVLTP
jgi:hypothetical protein